MSKARGPYRVDPLGYKKANEALDKMAENARELGLDYELQDKDPDLIEQSSEPVLMLRDTKPNHNMTFHNQDGKQVGALDFNGPEMTFTGDADESAKLFFDWIALSFKARLEQERADERNRLATKLVQDFKGAFGDDTCASWAVWIRGEKK